MTFKAAQGILLLSLSYILVIIIPISCKECPTEPEYNIYLSVEDVACIWVTLNVTLPDSGKINTFALERNDSTVATYTCYDDDTLITDDGLTPDSDYSYTVRFLKNGKTQAQSDPIDIHTMPTTSHDFIWEIDTLGIYGSYLKDAWIVDENDIWVVGNIETDSGEYNDAHWNGTQWELRGIYSNTADLYSIHYFSENDIWVTSHCFPIHWDGNEWTLYHIQNMGLDACAGNAIWASSPDDIYFVGRKGSIVHYDGSNFEKMESGTEINLEDIYGIQSDVFVTGSEYEGEYSGQSIVLHRNNSTWGTIRHEYVFFPQNSTDWGRITSVWCYEKHAYIMSNSGLKKYDSEKNVCEEWFGQSEMNTSGLYIVRVRGNALNDILLVDNWSYFVHYNGQDWKRIEEVSNKYPGGIIDIEGIDYKDDLIVAVGEMPYTWHGIVIRGYR